METSFYHAGASGKPSITCVIILGKVEALLIQAAKYEFIKILNEYIHWYAEKRIKLSLGGMSPIQYRQSLGLLAA